MTPIRGAVTAHTVTTVPNRLRRRLVNSPFDMTES